MRIGVQKSRAESGNGPILPKFRYWRRKGERFVSGMTRLRTYRVSGLRKK